MALIMHGLDHPNHKFAIRFREALAYAGSFIGGVAIYFVVNQICLKWMNVELSFLGGGYEEINGQYFLSHGVKLVIILTMAGALLMISKKQFNKLCKVWLLFLLMIFLLAVYLVKLFSTDENFHVHTLMVCSLVYVYVLPICILERTDGSIGGAAIRIGKYILTMVLSVLMMIYVYYDNAAYLKMNFVQEQAIVYFTTLFTQIKSVDGYKDEYPVVLLGNGEIEDMSFFCSENFSRIMFSRFEFDQSH